MTWHPFHVSQWPRIIRQPADYDGAERLRFSCDPGDLPEKDRKRVIAEWCARLPEYRQVRWLSIWSHVTPPLFEAACRMPQLECLQLKWSNLTQLDAIAGMQQLRYLHIGSSTKVQSLQPLTTLSSLRMLEIENFKLIEDFSPLLALDQLEVLAVTGSMWTRQKVASLAPFAQMTWLKSLAIDTASVKSLRPLASLTRLQSLGLGGNLPMQEYAWLAAKLPNTECRWFNPYLDLSGSGMGLCQACKQDAKVMLTGKGTKVLCRFCDKDKVAKHVAAFAAAKQAASQEGA